MLWVKSFHIVFMVTWFAGIFYLPRLFVYHSLATDVISLERFKVMERKLYYGITTPGAILTILFGFWLVTFNPVVYLQAKWLNTKLLLVFALLAYHIYCGYLVMQFKYNRNKHSHIFYRWLNEVPVALLITIVILAVVKPAL